MNRQDKIDKLYDYCDSVSACGNCELYEKYKVNVYECDFEGMNDNMVNKIYNCLTKSKQEELTNDSKIDQHKAICKKLNETYKAKNHDYGDSFGDTYKKLGIISAVTRLSDKMNRIMSLAVSHDAQVKDEKIEDTLLDMANYAIMTLIGLGYEVDENE